MARLEEGSRPDLQATATDTGQFDGMGTVRGPLDGAPTGITRPSGRSHQRACTVASLAFLIGLTFCMALAVGSGPDEGNHIVMANHHAANARLLTWQETQYRQIRGHPYHLYSPVGYLAYAPSTWAQNAMGDNGPGAEPDRTFQRLGGLLITVGMFFALRSLARRVAPSLMPLHHVVLAFVISLAPQLRYLSAYVTTDGYTVLAGIVCFAVAARVLDADHPSYLDAIFTGLAMAMAAHARYNAFPAAGALFLAFLWSVRGIQGRRERIRRAMVAIGIPVTLAGGFYLTVYRTLGNGHLLATEDADQLLRSTFDGVPPAAIPKGVLLADNIDKVPQVWMTSWFQVLGIDQPPSWVGWLLLGMTLPATMLLVLRGRKLLGPTGHTIGVAAVVSMMATWALMLTWPYQIGRFLLPTMVAGLLCAVATVASAAAKRWPDSLPRACGAPTVIFAVWAAPMLALNAWILIQSWQRAG